MARPTKQGIDYFPADTVFDDDMQLFVANVGAEGLGIIITIWQMIYSGHGYFIENDDKLPLKVKLRCFSSPEIVVSVVKNAIDSGIFSSVMAQKGVLTSRGIQRRFFTAARKKKEVIIARKYMLISVNSYQNLIDSAGNRVLNVRNATKEKEKEKEKEDVKEKEGKKTKPKFTPPTKKEVEQYFFENGYKKESGVNAWEYYEDGNPSWHDSRGNPVKAWKQKMRGVWFKDENKREETAKEYAERNGLN